MATPDEIKQDGMLSVREGKELVEYDHWCKVERIILSVCLGMVVIMCFPIGLRISEGNFSAVPSMMFISTALTVMVFFANFKPSKPVRIVREAIWLVTLLLVAFGALCWVGCLFGNDSTTFHEVIGRFKGCGVIFAMTVCLMGWCIVLPLVSDRRRFIRKEAAYREKAMGRFQNGLGARKVDAFLRKHPSLVVSNMKEFVFLVIRYMIWGEILYLLAYETYVLVRHCIF